MKKILTYFSIFEWCLYLVSLFVILFFFFFFKNTDYMQLATSLIGVTSLMLVSKGTPIGQLTTIIFSVFYGIVAYSTQYYGEMITYLGMTTPIAILALISWIKHPSKGNSNEVEINELKWKEYVILFFIACGVTFAFYFILKAFNTHNLIMSTVSVLTSFLAAYLTARRSRFYAFGYALNDIVLITLWSLAMKENFNYIATVITSCIFLVNDIYGFINWSKTLKKQREYSLNQNNDLKAADCKND